MINLSNLRKEYPPVISSEQMRVILRISKRKAAWMLKNGFVKYKDNGKCTRRYSIRLDDLIEYIRKSDAHPEHYHTPDGLFSAKTDPRPKRYAFPRVLPTKDFRLWLSDEWAEIDDVLTNDDVAEITGYSIEAVNRWIQNGKLRSVKMPGEIISTKEWLIDFYSGSGYNITQMNAKHVALMKRYFK